VKQHLVYETLNLDTAFKERQDFERMGFKVQVKEVQKVYKGGFQTVYKVWVEEQSTYRCPNCQQIISIRFPYHMCESKKNLNN